MVCKVNSRIKDKNGYELANFLENMRISDEKKEKIKEMLSEDINVNIIKTGSFGFKTEKKYFYIMSPLPWIKNIHGLDQNQTESSREKYQVPDYQILFENSNIENISIFTEVKNCHKKSDDKTYEYTIQKKKIKLLQNYARDNKSNILIAIYWSSYGVWTHNCFSSFIGKKKNSIDFQTAINNDLSQLFHDTLIKIGCFQRKTYFDLPGETTGVKHSKYGEASKVFLQNMSGEYLESDLIVDVVLNAHVSLEVIEEGTDDIGNYIIEKSSKAIYLKMTTIFEYFISAFDIDYKNNIVEIDGKIVERFTLVNACMVTAMKDFSNIFVAQYIIPKHVTPTIDKLLSLAYGDNWERTLRHTNDNPVPITKIFTI